MIVFWFQALSTETRRLYHGFQLPPPCQVTVDVKLNGLGDHDLAVEHLLVDDDDRDVLPLARLHDAVAAVHEVAALVRGVPRVRDSRIVLAASSFVFSALFLVLEGIL